MSSDNQGHKIPEDLRISDSLIAKIRRPLERMGFSVEPYVVSNKRGLTRRYSQAKMGTCLICLLELDSTLLKSGGLWRNRAPLSGIVETLRDIPTDLLIFSDTEFICQEALYHAKDLERIHRIHSHYLTRMHINEILRSDEDEILVFLNLILSHHKKPSVFLSYSMRKKNTAIRDSLIDFMTTLGLKVYYAPNSLRTDAPPGNQIAELIRMSDKVVALFTRDEELEKGKWRVRPNVVEEAGEGVAKHPIILAEEGVEVPSNIQTRQTYIPFERKDLPTMMIDLLKALKESGLI